MRLILLLLVFLVPQSAFAYLDPGTGSIILQAVIAAIAGSLFAIKTYWSRIRSFFAKKK